MQFVTVDNHTVVLSPEMQVISPEGDDITSSPKGRNLIAKAQQGYTQEQRQSDTERVQRNVAAFGSLIDALPRFLMDLTPGLGDALAAYDTAEALVEGNYKVAAILGVAMLIGVVPGVGDAIAAPLKAVARRLNKADLEGIAKAIKDGDKEFLTSWGSPQDAVAAGARPAKQRTIVVDFGDGQTAVLEDVDNIVDHLVEVTGKSRKTIQNNLAAGKPVVAPDGTVYREPKAGDNLGQVDVTDARETTLGQIRGYDGTFSDLMREHGIDPRSEQANTIRQRMKRGHDFEGFTLEGTSGPNYKQKEYTDRLKTEGAATRLENTRRRMDKIGLLDGASESAIKEWNNIWSSGVARLGKISEAGLDKIKSRTRQILSDPSIELDLSPWGIDPTVRRTTEKEMRDWVHARSRAATQLATKEYNKRRWVKSKALTVWKRYFKKNFPHLLEGKTAAQQRDFIADKLEESYLGNESFLKSRGITDS